MIAQAFLRRLPGLLALLPAATFAAAVGMPAVAGAAPLAGEVDLFELHPGPGTHLVAESTFALGEAALKIDGGSDTRPAFDDVTVQALWMPALAPGVTLALGARQDLRPGADLSHAVAGVEAELTPWLAAEHYFYLSGHGDLTGGAKATVNLPLGPGLRLEPRAELGWVARDIVMEQLASGITDVTLSVRLRQKAGPLFDVYAGAVHEAVVGRSADIARANNSPVRITRAVIGAGLSF